MKQINKLWLLVLIVFLATTLVGCSSKSNYSIKNNVLTSNKIYFEDRFRENNNPSLFSYLAELDEERGRLIYEEFKLVHADGSWTSIVKRDRRLYSYEKYDHKRGSRLYLKSSGLWVKRSMTEENRPISRAELRLLKRETREAQRKYYRKYRIKHKIRRARRLHW